MNRRGWHDEWRVTGDPDPSRLPVFDHTWRSDDPRWPDGLATVAARTFVQGVLEDETAPPWQTPPRLTHRRVFTGQWDDVEVTARPAWRRHRLPRQQGANT